MLTPHKNHLLTEITAPHLLLFKWGKMRGRMSFPWCHSGRIWGSHREEEPQYSHNSDTFVLPFQAEEVHFGYGGDLLLPQG